MTRRQPPLVSYQLIRDSDYNHDLTKLFWYIFLNTFKNHFMTCLRTKPDITITIN